MSIQEIEVVDEGPSNSAPPRKIWMCNRNMIPAKLSYFGMSGQVGTYAYFTNIFLRDVGLSIEQTGLISGMTYIVMALVSPLWGLLVDYTGRRKLIFAILFTLMASCVFSLPFVAYLIEPIHYNGANNTTNATIATASPSRHHSSFSKMFFAMLTLEVLGKIFTAPLAAMVDAAVMNVITTKAPTATFGDQRLYGGLAFGLMAFISGEAIDHFTPFFERHHMSKYTAAFCLFLPVAFYNVIACLALLNQMDLDVTNEDKKEEKSQRKLVVSTFSNVKNILFLLTCFVVGLSNMTLVGYLYMLMKDNMNSSKSLMGFSSLVQSIVQVLIFPFADRIIKMLGGPINAMGVTMFSYFIRFLANSYITNAVVSVVTQSFHATCFSLFWASAVVYTQNIAPKGIYVTMFTIVNGTYYGFGGIVANLLGGVIYGKFGGQILFRSMSVLCLIWTVVLLGVFHSSNIIGYFSSSRNSKHKVHPEHTS